MAEEIKSEVVQEIQDLQSVSKNLSELLTNSVNIVDKYYEIFFDQTPHYVELEQYDSDGQLIKTLVPNRALDRSVSLSGDKDPEGFVDGVLGCLYVNTTSRDLFIKKTTEGKIGWENITPKRLNYHVDTFDVDSSTTSVVLFKEVNDKNYIDIYVNGKHLEVDDFELADDKKTIYFNTFFTDYSKLQVKYIDGIYGLKGDTALTVNIGKVNTVNPDIPAKITNTGNNRDLILDFDIPKGATGDSGVWIGPEAPVENDEYLDDKLIWIDTSAEGYSELDLGVTRIFDSGNNTNPTAYKKAYNIMHSSVDKSKYAQIGDVNVDDKGILTAYGNGSGIRTTVKVKHIENKDWSISGKDYINIEKGNYQYFFNIGGQTTNSTVFYFKSSNKSFCLIDKQDDVPNNVYDNNNVELYDTYGSGWYNWKVEYKLGAYYVYISYEDLPLALRLVKLCNPIKQDPEEYIYISADSDSNYSQMLSDLKVFNIKVDNQVIWTPNKTGYEVIIDNNFTTKGNPNITDSGVLNIVSNGSHYIYGDYKAKNLADISWKIEGSFIHKGQPVVLWQFADPNNIVSLPLEEDIFAGDYKMLSMSINKDKDVDYVYYNLHTGLLSEFNETKSYQLCFQIEENKEYTYTFEYHKEDLRYVFTLNDGITTQTETYRLESVVNRNPLVCDAHPDYVIVIGSDNTIQSNQINIHIDLNKFKISERGRLVYRPLFRIPCTYASSGALFVDNKFRWMVEEAYEVHNKGHLFVIDEINKSITLPLDDIYSLVQREHISRPKYGKGLKYDSKTNVVENLVQGSEIGDVGEAVFVDESIGTRRILNGQRINIDSNIKEFKNYVHKLKETGLVVTDEEWELELETNGTCNKFVIGSDIIENNVKYHAYIPETYVVRVPIIEDDGSLDVDITVPERRCYKCNKILQKGEYVCTNCGTYNINIIDYNNDNSDTDNTEQGEYDERIETLPVVDSDLVIGYETMVLSNMLKEEDIIYTTSFNELEEDIIFRKINGVIYPDNVTKLNDILNTDIYYDYDDADFEITEEIEAIDYVRLPKINASKEGYQCYIQIATGVKNTVDIENNYKHISPYCFGMYQYSDVDLNNPGWLLSKGQWNSGAIYPTYYRWILDNANAKKDRFKKKDNAEYNITKYDYVVNEADGTFRLPLVASVSDFAQQRFLIDKKEATDSDMTWYNIYSDGWCEQGGREVILSGSAAALAYTNKTMALPVPVLHAVSWYVQPRHDCFGGNFNGINYNASYESVVIGQKNMNAANAYTNPWVTWRLDGYISETTLVEHFNISNLYYYVGDTMQNNSNVNVGKILDELAKTRQELKNILEILHTS